MCRFGGQCQVPYSVAQHCLYVLQALKQIAPTNYMLQLQGLLHDAAEAYLSDLVAPLKHQLPEYERAEKITEAAVCKGLKVPVPTGEAKRLIKLADNMVIMSERRDLLVVCKYNWKINVPPAEFRIIPSENWRMMESNFLFEYHKLKSSI
jgi:hypothetical protein